MRCLSAVARSLRTPAFILAFAAFASTIQALTATSTALAITSAGAPASTVSSGTVVTLTATVTAGSTHVTPGLVTFCDAAAAHCNDIHVVGTAQLTSSGIAVIKFRPDAGIHSYKAVFVGTHNYETSTSSSVSLTVTGQEPTKAKISRSGSSGNYTLTATVGGTGSTAPTGEVSFLDTSDGNAVLASATLGSGTAGLSFFTATEQASSNGVSSAAVADFNGDGILDVADVNEGLNTVSVLLGKGDGTFALTASSPKTGREPVSIAAGDFNSDGIPDLAVANFQGGSGGSVTVLLGNGDGTFSTKATIPMAGLFGVGVRAGDFNGDGIPDLAVQVNDSPFFLIFLGNGDGTFTAGPAFPTVAALDPESFAIADLNRDGIQDLAVVSNYTYANASIFLGNGDGSFSATTSKPTVGLNSQFIVAGDFNEDGIPDLAVTNSLNHNVIVLLGNGDGTFTATSSSSSAGGQPFAIVMGDFNGDGIADLVVAEGADSLEGVTVLQGKGDGTFITPVLSLALSDGGLAGVEPGDFDGDGVDDLVAFSGSRFITLLSATESATATAKGVAVPAATGTHNVVASYDGDDSNLASSSAPVTLTAAKGTPTVNLGALPATAPYGTPLTFTSTVSGIGNVPTGTINFESGIAILCTATLASGQASCQASLSKLGPSSITASYLGDAAYTIGTSTATTITITQATPAINWPSPAAITYGTALSATQLDATSPVAGTFAYTPAGGAILSAGQQTLNVTFTPTDTTDYTTAYKSVTLTVNQATPPITWPAPAAITYGTSLSATQLDATSTVAGSFAYTPASGTVLNAGPQTLSVTLTPTDTTDYTTANKLVTLTVNQATPSITWPAPLPITYGTPLGSAQLDASSTIAGTFAYSPAAGTVLSAGQQTLNVTFTPTDTTDYTTTNKSVTLTVNQATPPITWSAPAAITYGTALSATQLDATSTVPGTFAYTPAAGTILGAGTKMLNVTFTPTDTADYTTANKLVTLTVNQATPPITWPAPAAITYGTALSATQLDAGSTIAGTFSYSPAAGTVLKAGSQTLKVTFTPTDTADYTTNIASVTLTVNQATPPITWPVPAAITYGTALSATQLNATSSVAGTFAYTPTAGTILGAGTKTLSVTLSPTDTTDYTTATTTVGLTVNKASQTIAFTPPSSVYYGALPITLSATGGASGNPVVFSIVSGPGSLSEPTITR